MARCNFFSKEAPCGVISMKAFELEAVAKSKWPLNEAMIMATNFPSFSNETGFCEWFFSWWLVSDFGGMRWKVASETFCFQKNPEWGVYKYVLVWIILIFHISEQKSRRSIQYDSENFAEEFISPLVFFLPPQLEWKISPNVSTCRPVENGWKSPAASWPWQGGQAASARVTGVDAGHGWVPGIWP